MTNIPVGGSPFGRGGPRGREWLFALARALSFEWILPGLGFLLRHHAYEEERGGSAEPDTERSRHSAACDPQPKL
jgi:hypothetical protein